MIKKLPQNVINEIAAGEVIQRPLNVIKQLVQNSIDAGATQINIHAHEGGLKLIKISDNGKGIMVQDFPLLCARFATSKIQDFNDMKSLNSFGFRGEALASLSYVSNLTIASKWKQQIVGHSAQFKNQQIQGNILEIPMNVGTTITAEKLFSNSQNRRNSLNPMQEKKKVYKLLCHFCLHYPKTAFALMTQKGDQNLPMSKSLTINQAKAQIFQKITKLSYDKFSYVAPCKVGNGAEVEAIITKINCCKGKTLMLNINNRIVENPDLFKVIQKAYSECYQSIHQQIQTFWVYMSLKVQPKLIDCNLHPTKKAIGLFAGQETYECIKQLVLNQIKRDSAIKVIRPSIQTQLSKNTTIQEMIKQKMSTPTLKDYNGPQSQSDLIKSKIVYAFEKNRTDSKQMPLQYYSQPIQFEHSENQNQFFHFQFSKGQRNNQLKKFFGECSYVGCYGLNYVLIHFQNKLFMLNIVPFIPAFLHSFCRTNKLVIKYVNTSIDVAQQIQKFLAKTKLLPDVKEVQQWISQQRHKKFINELFSIKINESNKLVSYPCVGDAFIQCLDQDLQIGHQISYLICRVYNARILLKFNKKLQDKFFYQFISAQFIQNSKQLSPFNQKINNIFKNKVIPTLKTSPTYIEGQADPKKHMKQMLDLRDVYKVFERC